MEAWDIATSSNTVPISQKPTDNLVGEDGLWLPPPFDISKDYVKGKTGLIWDPTQPMGKIRRTPLLLSNRLTEAQNIRVINIYLHLPADFD